MVQIHQLFRILCSVYGKIFRLRSYESSYYMPHRALVKEQLLTTKFCVVLMQPTNVLITYP